MVRLSNALTSVTNVITAAWRANPYLVARRGAKMSIASKEMTPEIVEEAVEAVFAASATPVAWRGIWHAIAAVAKVPMATTGKLLHEEVIITTEADVGAMGGARAETVVALDATDVTNPVIVLWTVLYLWKRGSDSLSPLTGW